MALARDCFWPSDEPGIDLSTVHLCPILTGIHLCPILTGMNNCVANSHIRANKQMCPILTGMNKCVLFSQE